jgi:hypothetical protein
MKCDPRFHSWPTSFANPYLSREPKVKVATNLVQYENKVKTIERIHHLNENHFEGVQNPSHKYHLPTNAACVGKQLEGIKRKFKILV